MLPINTQVKVYICSTIKVISFSHPQNGCAILHCHSFFWKHTWYCQVGFLQNVYTAPFIGNSILSGCLSPLCTAFTQTASGKHECWKSICCRKCGILNIEYFVKSTNNRYHSQKARDTKKGVFIEPQRLVVKSWTVHLRVRYFLLIALLPSILQHRTVAHAHSKVSRVSS